MSTIEINDRDLSWWIECKGKLNMTSKEAFTKFRKNVELKKLQDFYSTLPQPLNFVKPLTGVKIKKNYRKTSGII